MMGALKHHPDWAEYTKKCYALRDEWIAAEEKLAEQYPLTGESRQERYAAMRRLERACDPVKRQFNAKLRQLQQEYGYLFIDTKEGHPMTSEEIRALTQEYIMPTYGRFPVVIDHGEGSRLYTPEGREYIDFTSGIGVNDLGYGYAPWFGAIAAQAKKLGHISNLFYTEPAAKLAETLCKRTGMSDVFFANGGGEANEGLIKLARKYSFDRYGQGRATIISLKNSFHGRTITTLKATGQEVFHNYFFPFTEGFRYADANDMDSLNAVAGEDVCAVLVELVQGEGGVLPLDKGYVRELSELCAARDWLLIVDEVQTGVGRTGTLFAFQQYGIVPDALTFAKGIAGGLPMSGILANEKCRDVLSPGTHATTFGANPVAAAAALVVQETLTDGFLAEVAEKGKYLREGIEALGLPCFGKTRGLGLMIGIAVNDGYSNREIASRLIENGLLVLTAGAGMRLLPPLVITKEEMDAGLAIMKRALA